VAMCVFLGLFAMSIAAWTWVEPQEA
jgi:hypothetical protein